MKLRIEGKEDKCNQSYEINMTNGEAKLNKSIKVFLKSSWALRTKISVEPFVVCYVLPSVLAGLAVQNLCFEKACLVNLQYDAATCHHIMQGQTQNYTEQEKNVQYTVTKMTAWSYPLQTALPGILALFIGAWSDRTGNRKAFMVLPIFGKLLSIAGLILSTVFFMHVGMNETALIEGLPPALAGGKAAMSTAVYSYVTDITSESERTFRLGIVTAVFTLSRPVGLAISGYMTNTLGYYGVFSIACAFYLVGFFYIVVRMKDKTKTPAGEKTQGVLMLFSIKGLVETIKVAFKSRDGTRRLQLALIMFAYMFIVGPVLGEAQMTYWFTRFKFKFTEVDYSLFLTYSVLVGSVGSFITIYLFSKRWKIEDSTIGVVACLSRIAASVVYALAPNRTIYFLGPVLDMFSSAGATSLRSMATKLVGTDEIGKTSSLISISEAMVPVIYSPVYSKVYLNTLQTFAGAFYLISAALAVPAIAILVILFALNRKDQCNPTAADTDSKRRENEITRF